MESTSLPPVQYMQAALFNEYMSNYEETHAKEVKYLNVELQSVKLKSHHTLTLEELLFEKLFSVYEEYENIKFKILNIENDIKISRNTKDNLKEELLRITNKKEQVKFDPTFRKYTEKLFALKDQYFGIRKLEKEILNKMICLWFDIDLVRQKYNTINCFYELEIRKTVKDLDVYEDEWNNIFDIEFSDCLDKIEYDFVTKYINYKKQKYEQKVEIENKIKIKMTKPKLELNMDIMKDKVSDIVHKLVEKENIIVNLHYKESIKPIMEDISKDTPNIHILFKIYVDDIFVCETDISDIKSNKEMSVSDYFSIQILPNNEKLTIVLYENDIKQAIQNILIKTIKKKFADAEICKILFLFHVKVEPANKTIGCGYTIKDLAKINDVRLKSSNLFTEIIKSQIEVKLKIGWNEENKVDPEQVKTYVDITNKIKQLSNSNCNISLFREVIEKVYGKNIDNDEALLKAYKNRDKVNNTIKQICFPVNEKTIDISRYKLLYLRNIGQIFDLSSQLIPLYSNQMSTEQINLLQKFKDQEVDYFHSERYIEMDPIETQRYIGSKYIENLNKNMLKNLNENIMMKTYKDVVCDFEDLSLR